MNSTGIREKLVDLFGDDDLLFADGFDEAIIGVGERCASPLVVVYDRQKAVDILVGQGMTCEEAEEYFEFNVVGAYVGERTPVWVTLDCLA